MRKDYDDSVFEDGSFYEFVKGYIERNPGYIPNDSFGEYLKKFQSENWTQEKVDAFNEFTPSGNVVSDDVIKTPSITWKKVDGQTPCGVELALCNDFEFKFESINTVMEMNGYIIGDWYWAYREEVASVLIGSLNHVR